MTSLDSGSSEQQTTTTPEFNAIINIKCQATFSRFVEAYVSENSDKRINQACKRASMGF